MLAIIIFCLAYLGIALGRIPGLAIDRVGVALVGAIAMVIFGGVSLESAIRSINYSTIILLYALMIISAQLRLGGFYSWVAFKIVPHYKRPRRFLLIIMLVSALLSAVLANDIVCFAFTPILAFSLLEAGLNPLPFLIGLAVSSNIGSAATIIGNPQNMLIGQAGKLDFADFFFWCGPPSVLALFASYLALLLIFRFQFQASPKTPPAERPRHFQPFNQWQTAKGLSAIIVLTVLFFTPIPRELSSIAVAGLLLCSRKMKSRQIMGLVDWHLITLFCALFIIIHGISQSTFLTMIMDRFSAMGLQITKLPVLTFFSIVLSNLFSNVPATMLLIRFLDPQQYSQWFTLAVSSTFAGNLFLLGSIANLIVVEQAAAYDIKITFRQHAAAGVPVTIISLAILVTWFLLI